MSTFTPALILSMAVTIAGCTHLTQSMQPPEPEQFQVDFITNQFVNGTRHQAQYNDSFFISYYKGCFIYQMVIAMLEDGRVPEKDHSTKTVARYRYYIFKPGHGRGIEYLPGEHPVDGRSFDVAPFLRNRVYPARMFYDAEKDSLVNISREESGRVTHHTYCSRYHLQEEYPDSTHLWFTEKNGEKYSLSPEMDSLFKSRLVGASFIYNAHVDTDDGTRVPAMRTSFSLRPVQLHNRNILDSLLAVFNSLPL